MYSNNCVKLNQRNFYLKYFVVIILLSSLSYCVYNYYLVTISSVPKVKDGNFFCILSRSVSKCMQLVSLADQRNFYQKYFVVIILLLSLSYCVYRYCLVTISSVPKVKDGNFFCILAVV